MSDSAASTSAASANPWIRRLVLGLLAAFVLIFVFIGAVWLWLNTNTGRAYVESRVEGLEVAGQSVEIEGLNGSLIGGFTLDRLQVSDADGPWLIAREINVAWSPAALLSKTLQVDALRVGDLDVLKRPVFVSDGSDREPRIETFVVEAFEFPDVGLSEAVIGRAIDLSASGQGRHGPLGGSLQLTGQSDRGDRIEADLDWSPSMVLSGNAEIDGPSDGLLAGMLRLGPDQSFSADVTTDGSQTRMLADIDDERVADLLIERSQSRVSITGMVEPGRLPLPENVSTLLGGQADIDAVLPLDQGAPATLVLRSPKVSLDAQGSRRDGIIELDRFTLLATDPLAPFDLDGIAIGRLDAQGRATIGQDYSFDGRIEVENLTYDDYRVDGLSGPAEITYSNGVAAFDTDLTGRASTTLAARADGASVAATGRFDTDTRRITLSRADIDLPGLAFSGRGSVGFGDRATAQFSGRYDVDTSVLRQDDPRARLRGEADIRTTADGPVIELSGRATDIEGLAGAVEPLADGGLSYTARVRLDDGRVVVPEFRAGNDRLDAQGSAVWEDGQISAEIDYTVSDYEFSALSASDVTGQATVTGPPGDIRFETTLKSDSLDTGGLSATGATATAEGRYADGRLSLSGTVEGDSEQGRVSTSGDVTFEDGAWDVANLKGSLGGLNASGTLSGLGGDIAALRGDLTVSGASPLLPAESVEGTVRLGDARVDVDLLMNGVDYWRLENGAARIKAVGPRDAVAFDIGVEGDTRVRDIERPLVLTAVGVADLRETSLGGESRFDLSLGGLELAGEAAAQRSPQGWSGSLDAKGLDGTIIASFVPGTSGGLTFDVNDLSVPKIASLLARPATEGSLSGEGAFRIVQDRIEGEAELALNDLRSPISKAQAVSVIAEITLRDDMLRAVTRAEDGGLSGNAVIEGRIETLPQAPFVVYPPGTPLQGRADLSGEIGPVVEIFLPPQTDVSGRIDTDLRFTLPNTPTGLQGRVALTNGRFEQGAIGLELQDIEMVAELSGETIAVPTFSARGPRGGTLRGSGRMGLGEGKGTVDIVADELRAVDRREGYAELSGELNISRTAELLRLDGDLQVTEAEIDISRLPEPGLPTLEVDFGDGTEEEETMGFASAATRMDLRIVSDGRINVEGRGLDAEMSLDARIRGPFNDPVVTGDMAIERGRFDFLSKRFEFRESSVILRDQIMKSIVALEAVRVTPDLTAVAKIGGTFDRPEITLTSEPNLPEDEVLSRILFGRSPTQLSAIEAARLAAALSQLSGGSGFDLFGSLEDAIGLDTLELGQSDTGQTQLTTGKYLSDDVYLEVYTAAEGSPGISVEWQIRDNIVLEAETIPNEREGLSVKWKKDFD
ncbi:translocation/assembly module TamB domain-containing protein [uncultured Algimonas sp.]|uniref:translocation/assembly module TamB domain-containing protein n=1 Tax=uncultured Algimonas sp. TaxID=1547920 RepID=UPI002610D4B4|nr:translocation/assembly module TamB domain-containing protein [uncultured Algimonas sp.]